GEVWEATAPGGFSVALKFVSLGHTAGAVELQALNIVKNIRHAHLVTIFGAWQTGGLLILAMELADRTLLQRLEEATGQGLAGIHRRELSRHTQEAAVVLDYLNKPRHFLPGNPRPVGIQHCDVKPQNLLLIGDHVKVADFGLARVLEGHTGAHSG